jgi:hypothetical protein
MWFMQPQTVCCTCPDPALPAFGQRLDIIFHRLAPFVRKHLGYSSSGGGIWLIPRRNAFIKKNGTSQFLTGAKRYYLGLSLIDDCGDNRHSQHPSLIDGDFCLFSSICVFIKII